MNASLLIIGGGASGLIAGIRAREMGADVLIAERQARLGKKLLVTGNGRCNLTNMSASESDYHGGTQVMAEAMKRYPPDAVIAYFRTLGVEPLIAGDRVYPMSEQASSVLDALRFRADELGVRTALELDVVKIERDGGSFRATAADGRVIACRAVIMACGGPCAPALGGTDAGLNLMRSLGFRLERTRPALVQLRTDTADIRPLTGIKFHGGVTIQIDGRAARTEKGEILFTEYGLSGPAVLQVSRAASVALDKRKKVAAVLHILDAAPIELLKSRRKLLGNRPVEHFLTGFINKRLGQVLLKLNGIGPMTRPCSSLSDFELEGLAMLLENWPIDVNGTQGLDGAQVTSGGVITDQFDPATLESLSIPGLYAAGELLDVDGDCGGFNLQWAWASGLMAAQSAAHKIKEDE